MLKPNPPALSTQALATHSARPDYMYGHAVTYVGEYFSYHINFFLYELKEQVPQEKKRFEDHNQNQFKQKKGSTKSKSIDKN